MSSNLTKTKSSMLSVKIQLYRPSDREPSDHIYGEPFDSVVDKLVGGSAKWSSPKTQQPEQPKAVIPGTEISIELHENGPTIDFVLTIVEQIPNYINAIAAMVSAWIVVREHRRKALPKDDYRSEGGTVVQIGDLRIESERNLEPDELQRLLSAIATTREDREKPTDGK